MEKFLDKEFVWPWKNNSQWILHSSDYKGCDARIVQMSLQIQQMFGMIPDNLDDYVHASQISQAEAKKYFIERVRKEKPQKSGVIWWNLLDGWPQFSDAVIDYYYEKKIAYNVIKRSQEPFFIMIDEIEDWNVKVIASNDTLEQKNGTYRITDIESAQILLEGKFSVKANAYKVLGKLPVMYSQQGMFIIEWFIEGKRYLNHYLYGTPPFSFEKYVKWMNLLIGCENGE